MAPFRRSRNGSLLSAQEEHLRAYRFGLRFQEQGTVVSVGDGIAWVRGLPSAAMDQLLEFEDGSSGVVFHLTRDLVGAVLLKETEMLTSGTLAHLGREQLNVPVGDGLLGRVVDPLGDPLDGGEEPDCDRVHPMDERAPGVADRDFVHEPLYTGHKIVDTMIPIGKGQRQLLIGDEGLGRSSLAIEAVLNQRGRDVFCVYVLIGQKRSAVVDTIETFRSSGALEYTTVVVGESGALPGLKYLAPFAGCAIAEGWMREGRDALVVYDDLSTHARAYRELSLLLRRPPGREAYPGDIFFLHARLLERATCLAPGQGGGTMTALPIVETQQGEIASYIPTNLISITDGQIYFDRTLFSGGFRPAIDVAKSVSRIGGRAQHPRIKEAAGHMKLDYLRFLELEVFTRFGARLERAMEQALKRGQVLREILKQERLSPVSEGFQMAWMTAFNNGLLDQLTPEGVAPVLDRLKHGVEAGNLTLEDDHDAWVRAVSRWLRAEGTGGS